MASSKQISAPRPNTHTEEQWKNTTLALKSPHWKPCYPVCKCQSSPAEGCQYGKAQWRRGTMNTPIICTHVWAINCVIKKQHQQIPQDPRPCPWHSGKSLKLLEWIWLFSCKYQTCTLQAHRLPTFPTKIFIFQPKFMSDYLHFIPAHNILIAMC